MSEVKTYDCTNGKAQHCYGCYTMTEDKNGNGDWVRKEDYDAALSKIETLKRALERVAQHNEHARAMVTQGLHNTSLAVDMSDYAIAALAVVEGAEKT